MEARDSCHTNDELLHGAQNGAYKNSPDSEKSTVGFYCKQYGLHSHDSSRVSFGSITEERQLLSSVSSSSVETQCCVRNISYANANKNSNFSLPKVKSKNASEEARKPTKELGLTIADTVGVLGSKSYIDCTGRRRQYIGEKCFALLVMFFIAGAMLITLGTICLAPLKDVESFVVKSCANLGGITVPIFSICCGGAMIISGVVSCILIHECGDKELHGGKCHINCHIFEDLVV